MDLKDIRQIIEMMKRAELTRFELEESGFKIKICRDLEQKAAAISQSWQGHQPIYLPQFGGQGYPGGGQPQAVSGPSQPETPAASTAAAEDEGKYDYITSPMVGTFYRAPSPDSSPYADVDTVVSENSIVCIIEAMKVMNEISSEKDGTIVEVLIENGEAVEYGQKLFKILPN